jgi:hypothetical protein
VRSNGCQQNLIPLLTAFNVLAILRKMLEYRNMDALFVRVNGIVASRVDKLGTHMGGAEVRLA